jgi:DNA polymerase III subunit alpha
VNRGVLEALVASGAFDATLAERGVSRAQAFAGIERALERARSASKDRERGQTSLFGLFAQADEGNDTSGDEYAECEPWDLRETLAREKEALGFYVSGHPLERYGIELSRFEATPTSLLAGLEPWARVRVVGVIEGYRVRIFKGGGGKVAFFTLEDTSGRIEVKVREKQIETYEQVLTSKEPVLVAGKLSFPQVEEGEEADAGPREPTLLLDEVVPLVDAIRAETRGVHLKLSSQRHRPEQMRELRVALEESSGSCPVQITVELEGGAEAVLAVRELRVEPSDALLSRLEKLLGSRVVELR